MLFHCTNQDAALSLRVLVMGESHWYSESPEKPPVGLACLPF